MTMIVVDRVSKEYQIGEKTAAYGTLRDAGTRMMRRAFHRLRSSRPYLEFLLDQASSGIDFSQDDNRRQFLAKMLAVAARIPEATARDQFADRIAHKARITEEVVRSEIRKAAVNRKTTVGATELPSLACAVT